MFMNYLPGVPPILRAAFLLCSTFKSDSSKQLFYESFLSWNSSKVQQLWHPGQRSMYVTLLSEPSDWRFVLRRTSSWNRSTPSSENANVLFRTRKMKNNETDYFILRISDDYFQWKYFYCPLWIKYLKITKCQMRNRFLYM